jgi:hypothetical protein
MGKGVFFENLKLLYTIKKNIEIRRNFEILKFIKFYFNNSLFKKFKGNKLNR